MKISKINRVYILSFLFSLHIALSAYVNSTFLTNVIPEKYVGLLFTISSVITLAILFKSTSILRRFGNRKLILGFLLVNMISLVGLSLSRNPFVISSSFIGLSITNTLIYLCLDIFIERFGNNEKIGTTRGLYLAIVNLAWVLSPLITAILITQEGGYRTIYLISFIITIFMTLGFVLSVKKFDDRLYIRTPLSEIYKYFKSNQHMFAILAINFILQFFYVWMIIYTPIYLNKHIGLGWDQIGVIFTIMLIPFVIFGFLVGILIDKFHIKKTTLLCIGIIIMSISTFLITNTTVKSIALWAIILFMTRVGATIIETTSEIYFFAHKKEEEAYLLGVFRDTSPVAYIVAPIIGTVFFMFFPFKYLFITLSVIVITGLYFIPKLKQE